MTNFLSNPFENSTVSPVEIVNSEDGAYRFGNENLSSFNFDGVVPTVLDDSYEAQLIEPGMYFVVPGTDDTLRSVVEVSVNEDDADGEMQIVYVGEDSLLSTYTCNGDDLLTVQYESWDEKVLGTQGWTITAGGNAIFTNVAVRGRIEAEEGYISGSLTIGSGGSTTLNDVATTDDLDGYIPSGEAAFDINTNVTTINGGKITTGTVTADKINTNNLFVQNLETTTNTGSQRIKISSDLTNYIQFRTGNNNETNYGYINTVDNSTNLQLNMVSPTLSAQPIASLNLMSQNSGGSLLTLNATSIVATGVLSGDGSGLTGVGSPIVVDVVGPSSPASYEDDTVWYVV